MTTDVGKTASDYFGRMVESYDDLIGRSVPCYGEMNDRLIEYLPAVPAAILELGCGTGNLSLRLAARFPDAHITLVDAAPEMIDITRQRLASKYPRATRFEYITATFESLDPAPTRFDLVTSCMSLHHVADKGPVYGRLRRALKPGGTFRIADHLAGATPWNDQRQWDRWIDQCHKPGHCTDAELNSFLAHRDAHDHNSTLAEQFTLLTAAGFAGVDCVWRDGIWAVLTADVASPD